MSLSTYFESPKSYWLRWGGILPSAIVAYVVGHAFFKIIVLFPALWSNNISDMWYMVYVLPAIAGGIAGYYFVYIGSMVAPNYKKTTGLILLVLLGMFCGAIIMILIFQTLNIPTALEVTGNIIGAFLAYLKIEDPNLFE